jgi:phage terminase large subunit-like protein
LLPFFFVPEEGIKRRSDRDRLPYADWVRQGEIIATDGGVIDYEVIRAKINELASFTKSRKLQSTVGTRPSYPAMVSR